MTVPSIDTNMVAEADALLTDQYKDATVVKGILDALVAQVQSCENRIDDVILLRLLDNATNAQLDSLGDLVGELRQGRTDTEYRAGIRVRILVNHSQGRGEDLLQVTAAYTGNPSNITDVYPAGWIITALTAIAPAFLAGYLHEAKAAATGGQLIYTTWPAADTFFLDSAYGGVVDPGLFDDTYTPGVSTDKMAAVISV